MEQTTNHTVEQPRTVWSGLPLRAVALAHALGAAQRVGHVAQGPVLQRPCVFDVRRVGAGGGPVEDALLRGGPPGAPGLTCGLLLLRPAGFVRPLDGLPDAVDRGGDAVAEGGGAQLRGELRERLGGVVSE